VGLGDVRLEPGGLAVLGDGLLQQALVLQSDPEVVVGFGVVLPEPKNLAELGDGLVQQSLLTRFLHFRGRFEEPVTEPRAGE
jgi:hypothetical protein